MEEKLFEGIFSEENLQKYGAIKPIESEKYKALQASNRSEDEKVEILTRKLLDFTRETWSDAEVFCIQLQKQFPKFFFVYYFEDRNDEIYLTFHAITKKDSLIQDRNLLQEKALVYEEASTHDFGINFDDQVIYKL